MCNSTKPDDERYIDLSSDIGFKICFDNPYNPDPLLGLLRALIPERTIERIEFIGPEIRPEEIRYKGFYFDVWCIEPQGTSFMVEVQKVPYWHMANMLMMFSGTPLKRLLNARIRYDEIQTLYMVFISDFFLRFGKEEDDGRKRLLRTASLRLDDNGYKMSNKYNFVFFQLPAVNSLYREQGYLEQLAYTIRNIHGMKKKPRELSNPYFNSLFEAADKSQIGDTKLEIYNSMIHKEIWNKDCLEHIYKEALKAGEERGIKISEARGEAKGIEIGEARGIEIGKVSGIEIGKAEEKEKNMKENLQKARALREAGMDSQTISQIMGVPIEEINTL